jgi:Sigma-70, region 4
MKRGKPGHDAHARSGPNQVNAALVRLLIADALTWLSAEHRAVLRRAHYLGWTTTQIADDLDIGERTVKSRLHFALRALRLTLQGQPIRCALDFPAQQRDGVLPPLQALLAAACGVGRDEAGSQPPGAGGI